MKRNNQKLSSKMSMIFIFSLCFVVMLCIPMLANTPTTNIMTNTIDSVYFNRNSQSYFTSTFDKNYSTEIIKQNLLQEVDKYIHNVNPNLQQRNKLALQVVESALSQNIDICFILAQGTIETSFGCYGAGRTSSRKSIFGVTRRYGSYTECIDDYISLLKRSYLVNGKTEHHLMRNYVNSSGYRYASNTKYEYELKNAYDGIKKTTKIFTLQKQLEDV